MSSHKRYLHSRAYSDECATGDGMCDGYIPNDETYGGEECGCSCHAFYTQLPETVEEVAEMHREERRLFGPVN